MNLRLAFLTLLSVFSFQLSAFSTDLVITAANVKTSSAAVNRTLIAGEAITAGQLVYRSASDFKVYLADANSATAAVRDVYAIAVSGAPTGGSIIVCLEDPDLVLGATVVNGVVYGLTATPGGIAAWADQTTGWYPAAVALGKSSTVVSFRAKGLRSVTAL